MLHPVHQSWFSEADRRAVKDGARLDRRRRMLTGMVPGLASLSGVAGLAAVVGMTTSATGIAIAAAAAVGALSARQWANRLTAQRVNALSKSHDESLN